MLESLMIQGKLRTEPNIGDFWEGGYYTGKLQIDGKIYALVLAPKSTGESPTTLSWKTSNNNTTNTGSLSDGRLNTQTMITAGATAHPAAKYCHDLVINGYDDWYLPSISELEMCYRAFKPSITVNSTGAYGPYGSGGTNLSSIPSGSNYSETNPSQTTVIAFRRGNTEAFVENYYWSSTQMNASFSWLQSFNNGNQSTTYKDGRLRVRAVRKVLIA